MEKFYNQTELAEYLGIKPRTLERWRYQNYGPAHIKVGRAVRYDRGVVEAWVKSQGHTRLP